RPSPVITPFPYTTLFRSRELASDGETETGYAQTGAVSIHTDEQKLASMKERALKRREDAPEIGEVTLLDANETKEAFPHLADRLDRKSTRLNSSHVSISY